MQLNAPAPRINSRIFFLVKAKGNNKGRFAHHLKVANRSFSVAEGSPARCAASAARAETLHRQVQGRSPWRAFGDFPRDGKVTRVPSMARPCSRGAPASGDAGASSPAQSRPGCRAWQSHAHAERPHIGEQEPSLATCSRGSAAPRISWVVGASAPTKPPGRGAERPLLGSAEGPLAPSQGSWVSTEARTKREKGAQAPFSRTAAAPAAPAGRPPPPEQSG